MRCYFPEGLRKIELSQRRFGPKTRLLSHCTQKEFELLLLVFAFDHLLFDHTTEKEMQCIFYAQKLLVLCRNPIRYTQHEEVVEVRINANTKGEPWTQIYYSAQY